MTHSWSLSSIESFQRLYVTDGLPLDAKRWNVAHDYHRRRQDLHHQAFQQAGIIHGFGVRVIAAPPTVAEAFKTDAWVEIQRGIAIDTWGNFIVLAQPEPFRLVRQTSTEYLYLVVSYVDPESEFALSVSGKSDNGKHHSGTSHADGILTEQLRIYEKDSPAIAGEVELCRIKTSAVTPLQNPTNVFFPGDNALDFGYRVQARSRPQALIQVAQAYFDQSDLDDRKRDEFHLSSLLKSLEGLYPAITAQQITQINLSSQTGISNTSINPKAQSSESLNRILTEQKQVEASLQTNLLQLFEQFRALLQGESDPETKSNILQLMSQLSEEAAAQQSGINQLEAAITPELSTTQSSVYQIDQLTKYDLIYLRINANELLSDTVQQRLKDYLAKGGVLLIEASLQKTQQGQDIAELIALQQELQVAIGQSEIAVNAEANNSELSPYQTIQNQLKDALETVKKDLKTNIDAYCLNLRYFAQNQLMQPLEDLEELVKQYPDHPLRSQPFLFSALPKIQKQPIKILTGGGIVLVLGDLSSAWGADDSFSLERDTIRTAQEMGINILYFACRRRQMTQLSQAVR